MIAAPILAGVASGAEAAQAAVPVDNGPFSVRAYGASSATSPVGPLRIERRAVGPNDILIDILYPAYA